MIKRLLVNLFCSIFFLLPVSAFSQEPANSGSFGIISAPLANVRLEPLPKSEILTQVLLGDEVRILNKQDNRYRIAIPSQGGREGWVQQEAVLVPKNKGRSYYRSLREWIVISVPKTPALILDKTGNQNVSLYAGTRLPVIEKTADGYKVLFPDRTHAVISASDAKPIKLLNPVFNDVAPSDLVGTARQFLGASHFAGGLTVQGMDTEGLIYIVYRIHGIDLDINRSSLTSKALRVAKKDLLPGDILLFYGEGLGLYLDNGRFLHSVRKTNVQAGGIFDRRYANSLQHGLRILGSDPEQKKLPLDMTADEIMITQSLAADMPPGKRIAYWAGRFIGTPYDTDPLGLYVRTSRIIADEKADCMYHTFRSVELALSGTPGQAVEKALDLRFINQGKIQDGLVQNYDDRYQYGEDMVFGGKWGKNITAELGTTKKLPGSRGREEVEMLPKDALIKKALQKQLKDGDIIFWVKDPKKRVVEEIVAHLAIVRVKAGRPYVVHAAGSKDSSSKPGGGAVKEVLFSDYVRDMRFIGAFVTRFEQ